MVLFIIVTIVMHSHKVPLLGEFSDVDGSVPGCFVTLLNLESE